MNAAKHTPGQWIAVGAVVEHADDGTADIASFNPKVFGQAGRSYEEMCANAKLCAAAPDLLDALKALRDFQTAEDVEAAYALADAAVLKATGSAL